MPAAHATALALPEGRFESAAQNQNVTLVYHAHPGASTNVLGAGRLE